MPKLSFTPANQWFYLPKKRHDVPWYDDSRLFWRLLNRLSGREKGEMIKYEKIEEIVDFILTADPNSDIGFVTKPKTNTKVKANLNKIRNIALNPRIKKIIALLILCNKDRETWNADRQKPAEEMVKATEDHIKTKNELIIELEKQWNDERVNLKKEEIDALQEQIQNHKTWIVTPEERLTIKNIETEDKAKLDEFINAMMPIARAYAKAHKIQLPRSITPGVVPSFIRWTKSVANTSAELQLTFGMSIAIVSQVANSIIQEMMYRIANTWAKISKQGADAMDDVPSRVPWSGGLEKSEDGLRQMHDMFGSAPERISAITTAGAGLAIVSLIYKMWSLVPHADIGDFNEPALDKRNLHRMVSATILATILALFYGNSMGHFLMNAVEQIFAWYQWPATYKANPGH